MNCGEKTNLSKWIFIQRQVAHLQCLRIDVFARIIIKYLSTQLFGNKVQLQENNEKRKSINLIAGEKRVALVE